MDAAGRAQTVEASLLQIDPTEGSLETGALLWAWKARTMDAGRADRTEHSIVHVTVTQRDDAVQSEGAALTLMRPESIRG